MALIKCFLKKTKDEEENIKMQQMASKKLETECNKSQFASIL